MDEYTYEDNEEPVTSTFAGKPALLVPVLTPFGPEYEPLDDRLSALCKELLAEGAHGIVVFGTTGEAASMDATERRIMLECLVSQHGVDPSALMVGCGFCSMHETVDVAAFANNLGCGGVLVMPPFFHRDATEDGRYAWFAEIIETICDHRLRMYLYHFPQMSGQPITLSLIERLLKEFPETIAGMKDSAGLWEDTAAAIAAFPELDIYSGSEEFLLRNLSAGGAGCISATANANARAIRAALDQHGSDEAERLQAEIAAVRAAFAKQPMIPALKAYHAHRRDDEKWNRLRPPLLSLPDRQRDELLADVAAAGLGA